MALSGLFERVPTRPLKADTHCNGSADAFMSTRPKIDQISGVTLHASNAPTDFLVARSTTEGRSRCQCRCPLRVIIRHTDKSAPCPLYPRERTFVGAGGMSEKCQIRALSERRTGE